MKNNLPIRRTSLIQSTALTLIAFALAAGPAFAQEAQEAETIVVTAQKRSTVLLDTAETLTAVTGNDLRATGGSGFADLGAQVPSLAYTANFGISQIYIRGVGNSFFNPGGDPGVALHSDGVYLSDQEATGVAFLDVARVEVLRGPQGALYGRNATGGAINLVSKRPTDSFEGEAALTLGDFGRLEGALTLSGPISAQMRGRLAIEHKTLDGFATNTLASCPDHFDDEGLTSVRAQIEADLAGGTLRLIASGLKQDNNGPALKVLPDPFPQPAEFLYGVKPPAAPRTLTSEIGTNEREVKSLTGIFERSFNAFELTVIADIRSSDRAITFDQDGTARPVAVTTLDTQSEQKSLEVYAASQKGSRFEWLVGATAMQFDQSRVTTVPGQLPGAFLNPALPLNFPVPFRFEGGGDLVSNSWATYGELGYKLNDQVTVRGGVRYNSDEKKIDEFLDFFSLTRGSQSKSWSKVSGKGTLEWRPQEKILVYGSISSGFKAGALNLGAFTPSVRPETIENAELGLKLTGSGNRPSLSIAAFNSSYSDLQIVQIGPLSQILANAAEATIQGIEGEASIRPIKELTLSANFSYLDASFDRFSTTDPRRGFASFDLKGKTLPMVSDFTGGVRVQWRKALANGAVVMASGAASWRSDFYFTEFNTPDALQKGYGKLDVGVSWTSPNGTITLSAYGRNLSDETTLSSMSVVSPLLGSLRVASYDPPRHFGVSIARSF
ncbi:TonB-dependent receptor [Aquidulcibacter sp.]|uniref:TonB-dependent receptor n=1 Tax=Aquidulcibacter sp. TaxID=2052990 RepID=UPI003BA75C30